MFVCLEYRSIAYFHFNCILCLLLLCQQDSHERSITTTGIPSYCNNKHFLRQNKFQLYTDKDLQLQQRKRHTERAQVKLLYKLFVRDVMPRHASFKGRARRFCCYSTWNTWKFIKINAGVTYKCDGKVPFLLKLNFHPPHIRVALAFVP